MKKRHLRTIRHKRNLNTKQHLLQKNQNADTILLHSHDEMCNKMILGTFACKNSMPGMKKSMKLIHRHKLWPHFS